jgi:hypothetical protein
VYDIPLHPLRFTPNLTPTTSGFDEISSPIFWAALSVYHIHTHTQNRLYGEWGAFQPVMNTGWKMKKAKSKKYQILII